MARSLIIIDLIGDCLRPLPLGVTDRVIAATNDLVALFRQRGLPVIWVRQEFAPDLSDALLEMRKHGIHASIAGTEGAAFDPRLAVDPGDPMIVKKRYSAFFRTGLDDLLANQGTDEIVLAGVNTHACIRTAAIDAYQRDLEVILATDCLASYDEEHARVSLAYMDGKIARVMSNSEIAG
ncbi:cysteine hydrolase family protein [Pelagerythrobacter sp.]|uniref:cysteine hydrolase family protein n=1 Tax=Pelagerythrobacter sp. TaxID=2800702 RepID=UPI0035B19F52